MFHFQHLENGESILGLCKCETIPVLLKFNPKEMIRGSKVFETEVMFERGNEIVNLRGRWSNDKNGIGVNEKVERTSSSVIERCISLGAVKTEIKKLPDEFFIPLPRYLFETI